MNVTIPKTDLEHTNYPCWVPVQRCVNWKEVQDAQERGEAIPKKYEQIKPIIRCQCGAYCGIGLHHVHPDGRVTASFFHTKHGDLGDPRGCEWHVFLTLADWTGEEYPPRTKD